MPKEPHNNISDEEAILNELIRASRGRPAEGFERPNGEAITAYLMGMATEEQERAVRAALLQSAAFRREILNMAQDMETLASLEGSPEPGQEIVVPDRREFLKSHGRLRVRRSEPDSLWLKFKNLWTRLVELRIPQVYAPTLAAVAVLAIILWPSGPAGWTLVAENLDPGILVTNVTREASMAGMQTAFPDPAEAALSEFRHLLKFEDGEFQLNPVAERPEQPVIPRTILLQLVDENVAAIQHLRAHIPLTEASSSEPVMAWALGLPSRTMYRLDMPSDSVVVEWTEDMGLRGCVTFTYRDVDGYRAVIGFTLDIQ